MNIYINLSKKKADLRCKRWLRYWYTTYKGHWKIYFIFSNTFYVQQNAHSIPDNFRFPYHPPPGFQPHLHIYTTQSRHLLFINKPYEAINLFFLSPWFKNVGVISELLGQVGYLTHLIIQRLSNTIHINTSTASIAFHYRPASKFCWTSQMFI